MKEKEIEKMKPEPLTKEIEEIFREEENKYIDLGFKRKRTSIDVFHLLDRIRGRTNQAIQQRVQRLLKEIEKKCKEWQAIDYYRQPTFGEIEAELKNLIKNAFSGVIEE